MSFHSKIKTADLLIDANELRRAVKIIAPGIHRWNPVPVLSTALVSVSRKDQVATLTTSDLDKWIETKIPVEATKDLKFAAPFDSLSQMARLARSPLGLALEGDKLTMMADEMNLTLRLTSQPEDFPLQSGQVANELADLKAITIGEAELHRLLTLGQHCISKEETRYYLNGTFLTSHPETGVLRAVSTDGHRMGVIDSDTPVENMPSGIVPVETVKALGGWLNSKGNQEITLRMMDGWLRADFGATRICSKLIDGTYPNYLKVVPGKAHEGRATLASAPIARIAAMANAAWRHMRKDLVLDLKAGEMRITQPDGDQITHPLQSSGDFQIGICLRYIQEQMKATPDVSLTVASPGEPILVQPEDPNALFVLMPVRVR